MSDTHITPKKAFYGMLTILLLTIGGTGFGIYQATGMLKEKATHVSKLKATNDARDVELQQAWQAKQRAEELQSVEELTADFLPESKQQSELVAEILQLAQESGLSFTGISFNASSDPTALSSQTETATAGTGVLAFPFSLPLESPSYNQIIDFLERTEQNRRKMQINSIVITPPAEAGDPYTINLEMTVYVRGQVGS